MVPYPEAWSQTESREVEGESSEAQWSLLKTRRLQHGNLLNGKMQEYGLP